MTTVPGLEPLLREELQALNLEPRTETSGVTSLLGDWPAAATVLVHSRIASRLLLSIRRFPAVNQAMLYDQVRRIDWPALFPVRKTMAIFAHGHVADADYNLAFAPLRIKDAVCDEFRKRVDERPSVDRQNPDVRIEAFFFNGQCELSIDLSGEPLHRRGYRKEAAEAPLRENRSAALVVFSGYDGSKPLVDPFCGSGTIAIEAGLIAVGRAPGTLRKPADFGLFHLYEEARGPLETAHRSAMAAPLRIPAHAIRGVDVSDEALAVARENARKAGLERIVTFERGDAREIEAPDSWIVTNPPYGERLETPETAAALIREFTHRVKHHCLGSFLTMVLPKGDLEHAIGFKPARKLTVESGTMTLRFLNFEIYGGSRKGKRVEAAEV